MNIVNKILFEDKKRKKNFIFSIFLTFSQIVCSNCFHNAEFKIVEKVNFFAFWKIQNGGKVQGRYREAICKVYEGYMLDICWGYVRLGDGQVMVKLKIRNPQLTVDKYFIRKKQTELRKPRMHPEGLAPMLNRICPELSSLATTRVRAQKFGRT